MLDLLKGLRGRFYEFSHYEIFGIQIDSGLHVIAGFLMLLLLRRYFTMKRSLYISLGVVILKEIVDLLAKPHLEGLPPPRPDAIYDLVADMAGILGAMWFIRRRECKRVRAP